MVRTRIVPIVLVLAGSLGAAAATAQPSDAKPACRVPERVDDGKPAPQHQRLMARAGRYTVKSVFTMAGAAPVETAGEATLKPILGGRFVQMDEKGVQFGGPFEAVKVFGNNVASGKYESVWMYTGSTAVMTLSGTSADGGKTVQYGARFDGGDAGSQEFGVTVTETTPDSFTVLFAVKLKDGTPGPTLRSEYARVR